MIFHQLNIFQQMSLYFQITKISLEVLPEREVQDFQIFLKISSSQQQIESNREQPSLLPLINLEFITSLKSYNLTVQLHQVTNRNQSKLIGETNINLYSFLDFSPCTKINKKFEFKRTIKQHQLIHTNHNEIVGEIRLDIIYRQNIRFLGQISKVNSRVQTKVVSSEIQQDIRNIATDSIEEISIIDIIDDHFHEEQVIKKNNHNLKEQKKQMQKDHSKQQQLKQTKVWQSNDIDNLNNGQSRNTKPKINIFQRSPIIDTTHIAINQNSNLMEVYQFCCGEIDDAKYTLETSY